MYNECEAISQDDIFDCALLNRNYGLVYFMIESERKSKRKMLVYRAFIFSIEEEDYKMFNKFISKYDPKADTAKHVLESKIDHVMPSVYHRFNGIILEHKVLDDKL